MNSQPVDDRFRSGNLARMLQTPSQSTAPMAMCPHCDEPLVSTFEFRGAEFVCVVCDGKFGWLAPKAAESTPAREARWRELSAQYDTARALREASP